MTQLNAICIDWPFLCSKKTFARKKREWEQKDKRKRRKKRKRREEKVSETRREKRNRTKKEIKKSEISLFWAPNPETISTFGFFPFSTKN